jgi:hypothetical protein
MIDFQQRQRRQVGSSFFGHHDPLSNFSAAFFAVFKSKAPLADQFQK